MSFPARYTVGWHQYSDGATTARNTKTAVYTPPLDEDGTELKVIGFATGTRSSEADETRVITQPKLYAPPDCLVKARDVLDLPDGQFEVDGDPDNQCRGFHGWRPGVVVWLKRVQR